MNGLVPPLIMELNVDTLEWCTKPLPPGYPENVRTYTMTNDHYLLKSCWLGPYVKMSHWLDKDSMPPVYGPIASRMESAGNMLKNLYSYFDTHDVLLAADFNPDLSTDLTFVQVTKHTAATFKMETPTDLNDPNHPIQSCVFAETDTDDAEFYNPIYDSGSAGFGFPGRVPETVTVNSRLLSDNFCADDRATLKDTLSRVPGEMNERIYKAFTKMREEYARMRNLYSKNGVVPLSLPGVRQPQQALQAQNAGGLNEGLSVTSTTSAGPDVAPTTGNNSGDNDSSDVSNQDTTNLYQVTEYPSRDILPNASSIS